MPSSRMDIAFDDVLNQHVTYKHDSSIVFNRNAAEGNSSQVGLAVMITAHKTVGLATDGAPVEGKLILVEPDGKCNVEVNGYPKLPGGNAATLTPGRPIVGALGVGNAPGYVRIAASAADALVARGAIVDSSDPTAVTVRLT